MTKRKNAVPGHLTVEEATEELGVSRNTLYYWLNKLGIAPTKVANASIFSEEEIERIKQHQNRGRNSEE